MSDILCLDYPYFEKRQIGLDVKEWRHSYDLESWMYRSSTPKKQEEYRLARRTVRMILTPNTSITLPGWLSGLTDTIKESTSILEIGDNWDEYGSPGYDEGTLVKAINLLVLYARKILDENEIIIDAPRICASQDGSIDLFWETDTYKLLINIPRDETAMATYYGRHDTGEFINGGIFHNSFETGVSQFLIKGKRRSVLSS